jgi:Coenzyme PQQ synthesis protein D (PqqD)
VRGVQIEVGTTLRRAERAVHGDLPRETVVLDADAGVALKLNGTGAWIWGQLEEPQPVGALARGLAARFEIDERCALDDVLAFAREMTRRRLLAVAFQP